jgi:Ca2+-binding EF-hand superfamily protein
MSRHHSFLRCRAFLRRWATRAAAPALLCLAAGNAAGVSSKLGADEPAAKPAANPAANLEYAQLFKKLDANGDGQIAKDEVPEEQRRLLERLIRTSDKNGDGKLSADEFAAGLAEERPKSEVATGAPGGGRPGAGGQFDPGQFFRMMDRNNDGKVTPDEVPEERRERFKENLTRIDENKDGAASLEEFQRGFAGRPGTPNAGTPGATPGRPGQPAQPGRPGEPGRPGMPGQGMAGGAGPVLAALDADRDGELSADEIAKATEALKKLDRDGDGKLTRMEIAPRPQQPGGAPGAPGGTAGAPGGAPGDRPDGARMLAYFKQQDKNGDGKLSKDEVNERMKENFSRIDGNGDGLIDDTELKQMVERFSRGGGPDGRGGARPEGGRPEGRRPEGRRPGEGDRPAQDRKPEADKPAEGSKDKPKAE